MTHSDRTESLEKRLANDDITYTGELSEEKYQGYYLSAEQANMADAIKKSSEEEASKQLKGDLSITDNVLTSYPGNTLTIDPEEPEKSLEKITSDPQNILYGEEYYYREHFSKLNGESMELEASPEYEGIPFQDDTAKLELTLEKDGSNLEVTKYSQTYLTEIEKLREKMDLYTEKEAVRTLYSNNKIPSGSKITWSELAYTRSLQVREKNVYVPVWFIAIETSNNNVQVESVNALSNTIVTNNVIPKVENQ